MNGGTMGDAPDVTRTRPPYIRFVRWFVPHLALVITFFLYLLLGAAVFMEIEGDFGDLKEVEDDKQELKDMMDRAHICTKPAPPAGPTTNAPNESNATTKAQWSSSQSGPAIIGSNNANISNSCHSAEDVYNDMMMKMETKNGWKLARMQSIQCNRSWTFTSSMLFCMTTITTIGYGDVVPVTRIGRMVCIVYAAIGFPITLLCLADIGNSLAKVILFICKYIRPSMVITRITRDSLCACCTVTPYRHEEEQWNESQNAVGRTTSDTMISTDGHAQSQLSLDSNRLETLSVPTLEMGSIDRVPRLDKSVSVHSQGSNGIRESLYTPSSGRSSPQTNYTQQFSNTLSHIESAKGVDINPPSIQHQHSQVDSVSGKDMHDTDEVILEEVPISIVSFIFVGYTCIMAFSIAEIEDWTYDEAVYFTFITLTTIGFGDVLPTAHYSDGQFFTCITFVMFGLAVNSMCISLVQAKVTRFCKRLAAKLCF